MHLGYVHEKISHFKVSTIDQVVELFREYCTPIMVEAANFSYLESRRKRNPANSHNPHGDKARETTHTNGYIKRAMVDEGTKQAIAEHLQETILWSAPEDIVLTYHTTYHPGFMEERRLLHLQDMIEEEKWIGIGLQVEESPSHNGNIRNFLTRMLENTPAWTPEDDILLPNSDPDR